MGYGMAVNNSPEFDYIDLDPTAGTPTAQTGRIYWDESNKTVSIALSDHVILQLGQEQHVYAVNKDSINLTNGTVVSITGAQGNRPKFARADSTAISSTNSILGMMTEDISKNSEGYVAVAGTVRGLNTQAYTVGQVLYLDPTTAGGLTTTRPQYPNYCYEVGIVLVAHNNDGEIQLTSRRDYASGDILQSNSDGTARDVHIITGTEKTLVYDSPTWDDLPPNPIIRSRSAAANNPTLSTFEGAIQSYTFAVNDYVMDNMEILHSYKEGTNLYIHIHWANQGNNTDNRYVQWQFEYTIANGSANGASQFGTPAPLNSGDLLIPANHPTRSHFISPIGQIPGSLLKIGAVIIYNIRRIVASGTAPTNNPYALQVAAHIQQDTQGSRQLFIK